MADHKLSQELLVSVLLVLISTVVADINSDALQCMVSQESLTEQIRCQDAFPGPSPTADPTSFIGDPQISNYCSNYKSDYIKWATCYNTVLINCFQPEHQGLTMSNSGLQSSIEYYCEREAAGHKFNITCEGFKDNPELEECSRSDEITTPSGNISYEGLKYNLCHFREVSLNCFRNDEKLKETCPETQTTYTNILEKQSPPACDAGNKTGIGSLILFTFLLSLYNN